MVVCAISIVTKGGKPLLSRQFLPMTRERIDYLLGTFPGLLDPESQHNTVETKEVRYLYQPLEELYVILITNLSSNIIQDVDTLQLCARLVSDIARSASEKEVITKAFDIMMAFDEVINQGYREAVNFMQVKTILEMESHEEKIQEIISRNKEAEAKEELKRRAKQLEMQRREQQRRTAAGGGGSVPGYLGGGMGSSGGYSSVPRFEAPSPTPARNSSPAPAATQKAPAFKGSGMKLGSKKGRQGLLDALGPPDEEEHLMPSTPGIPETTPGATTPESTFPAEKTESVHIAIKETLSVSLLRDGGVTSMDLKGEMNLQVTDPTFSHIKVTLSAPSDEIGSELQYKQHPNVAKFAPTGDRVVALKDSSRGFPVGQALGVLRWRYTGKNESYVPLSINCWPTPSNDGVCHVNIEYELENEALTLQDTVIAIPLPAGSYPTVTSHSGAWSLNPSTHSLEWTIPFISSDETSGTLEFNVGGDDPGAFFPVEVRFVSQNTLSGLGVASVVALQGGDEVVYSEDVSLTAGEYIVS